MRHTRTKPRHAWTNGYVERLQASLDGFLQFYNFDRPHQGYRTKGRTPAAVFWGAINSEVRQEA